MMERFGQPVPNITPKELYEDAPGIGWEVSDQTRREIAAIDENIRMAPHQARMLKLDGKDGNYSEIPNSSEGDHP